MLSFAKQNQQKQSEKPLNDDSNSTVNKTFTIPIRNREFYNEFETWFTQSVAIFFVAWILCLNFESFTVVFTVFGVFVMV